MFSELAIFLIVLCSEPRYAVVQTEEETRVYVVEDYIETPFGYGYAVEADEYYDKAIDQFKEKGKTALLVDFGECDSA